MNFNENYKKRVDKPTYNANNRNENPGIKRYYDRISAINSPLTEQMLTEINLENNNSKLEKQFGCLIYKSIFNSLEKKGKKDNLNNKTTDNDININNLPEKENRKNYISHTNKKINKNIKLNINLINQIQNANNDINNAKQANNKNNLYSNKNILNTNININNIYNEDNKIKDSQFNIDKNNNYKNYSGGFNNDIKYKKQYSANQDNKISINNVNSNNNSSNKNLNLYLNTNENIKNISNFTTPQNLKNDKKTLKYQKSEDKLNRNSILDKQEFMKNIKEIDDLEYLDENINFSNDKNDYDIFSQKELLSNNNNDAIFGIGNGQNKIIKKSNFYIENKCNSGRNKKKTHFLLPTNNNNENHLNSLKSPQNSFVSTTNNSNINNKNYNKNTYNNNNSNKNIITNNQNQNNININVGKEKLYNNNLSNYENNIVDMNKIKLSGMNLSNTNIQKNQNKKVIYDNGIDFNSNSFYSHNKSTNYKEKYNNFIMSPETNKLNYFATLSNGEIDNSYSNNNNQNNQINQNNIINNNNNNINYKNIDNLIYNKIQNYNIINNNNKSFNNNKSDNLTNEFFRSFGSNNYDTPKNVVNNMLNVSCDKKNYMEIKENCEKLKKELAKKNNLIEKYIKIIKDYKEKYGKLLIKNKQLQEFSKSKQITLLEQIKEYQNEIYKLKNDINYYKQTSENNSKIENNNNNNSNANISDYIRQINELKEELENYKNEANNLKILALQYKNNNINNNLNNNTFSQTQMEENLRNRFYSSKGLDKKHNKKSFSATKTKKRIRASSLSKKNFEEGDIDLPSDNNHVSSFMLY